MGDAGLPLGSASTRGVRWRHMLRALQSRNYRLFFSGQLLSLIGTWLSMVATSWLVYRLSAATPGSRPALVLGIVGFASQAPQLLLAPFAGVWVDRLSRHRILVATQALSMMQSAALAYLAWTNLISIPWVIGLNLFQGFVNALDMPARQAFAVEMVERREDLPNAIALTASMVHTARFVGPAVAGYLIYHFGERACFTIDAVSYLAVLTALLFMRITPVPRMPRQSRVSEEFREGWQYAWKFPPIRSLLILTAATSVFSVMQSTLLPIYADQVFGGRERVYGWLLGASGAGALLGALTLAARPSVLGLGRVIAAASIVIGVAIGAFGVSPWLGLSLPLLAVSGFCFVTQLASANTVLQTIVEPDKRGRVMSLYAVSFQGMAPLGALVGGVIAARIGSPATLVLSGAGLLISGLNFSSRLSQLRVHVRPIYERLGLYSKPE
jgi:MFS family permease